jgi:DNA-binding NarL/FixJ family response regulator
MAAKIMREFARLAEIEAGNVAGQLTPREKQVLQKLSTGLSNKEIAQSLFISENTVKVHVTNVLKKLHLQNRSQAADYARQLRLYEGQGQR